jgi:hypothetical protein
MTESAHHFGNCWMYRDEDRRFWHAWDHGVHTHWRSVMDDFGNLVNVWSAS